MFCQWCKALIPEDEVCDNKICNYLSVTLKDAGLLQFYLKCYSAFEPPEDAL